MKIDLTTLNAVIEHRWSEELEETAPHVVLRWGDADVAKWRLSEDESRTLTALWNDGERELQEYVAGKLAALFATS